MTAESNRIKQATTLKDALEFLARIHDSGAASTVGKALEEKVKEAVHKLGAKEIRAEFSLTKEITKNLSDVLKKASELRDVVVTALQITYGQFSSIKVDECKTELAGILIQVLPNLYNTLFYMYFQVSGSFRSRGGGGWELQKCKPSSSDDEYLHK
ncbi:ribosome-binding protein 1 [Babesia caballi]|uniref:Ribosome-binding protein 1 n=1 Tax=Babesia caballi TaxID=5871 RepID=A0AAV4LMQ2_BABCB|nr:ribosome-binding protein 1 [Babesia caballi]